MKTLRRSPRPGIRAASVLLLSVLAVAACDGKTAAENHREATGQQTAGGLKQGVGGLIGDKSMQRSGEAQSERGRTNEKVGDVKDAVHNVVH